MPKFGLKNLPIGSCDKQDLSKHYYGKVSRFKGKWLSGHHWHLGIATHMSDGVQPLSANEIWLANKSLSEDHVMTIAANWLQARSTLAFRKKQQKIEEETFRLAAWYSSFIQRSEKTVTMNLLL